jgi:putative restriction endonuclease
VLSGLREPLLLDAAHIVTDRDEQLGQPVVPNGIPLSKIHHAAFDAHHAVSPRALGLLRPRRERR